MNKIVHETMRGTPSHEPETVSLVIQAYMNVGGKLFPMECIVDGVNLDWLPYDATTKPAGKNDLPEKVLTIEIAQRGGRGAMMRQRCIP